MKGGRIPIHIMRWAPADYVNDPFVRLLVAEEDFATLTFYHLVLNWSHMEGGDLPADPRQLAASLGMRRHRVVRSLQVCVDAGKLKVNDGRLYHPRVVREVKGELTYRAEQAALGRKGGQTAGRGRPKETIGDPLIEDRATPIGIDRPAVRRAPAPTPAPTPVVPPAPPDGDSHPPVLVAWSREACDAWIARFGGTAPGGQIGKALKPLVDRHGWSEVATAWRSYLTQTDAEYASPSRFAATYGRWSGTAPPGTARESSADVLRAAVAGGLKGK